MTARRSFGRRLLRHLLTLAIGLFLLNASLGALHYLASRNDGWAADAETWPFRTSPNESMAALSPQSLFSLDALTLTAAAGGPCTPLGEPRDGRRFRGSDHFYLCKEGERFKTRIWGETTELFIACRPSTTRAGWRWRIWCNADGSHCSSNRGDYVAAAPDCCNWSAGDHCTVNGTARPGQNGSASW